MPITGSCCCCPLLTVGLGGPWKAPGGLAGPLEATGVTGLGAASGDGAFLYTINYSNYRYLS